MIQIGVFQVLREFRLGKYQQSVPTSSHFLRAPNVVNLMVDKLISANT